MGAAGRIMAEVTLTDVQGRAALLRRELDKRAGKREAVLARLDEARAEVAELTYRTVALDEAAEAMATYGEERAEELQRRLEVLVTHGLKTIFTDVDLRFGVKTTRRGKQATTEMTVSSTMPDGTEVETDVLSARGGGVAAVIGFLLRLSVTLLRQDARPTLVLDETFAQLSAEYEPAMADFLRELVDRTNCQVILVTHSHAFDDVADRAYRFSLTDGETHVTEMGSDADG